MIKVLVRADNGKHVGSGHIMRCLTLSKKLKEMGAHVEFAYREHFGSFVPESDFKFHKLGDGQVSEVFEELPYDKWLGTDQRSDRDALDLIVNELKPDVLIIDHYGIEKEYESYYRKLGIKVFIVDDLMSREHDCDFILDQNLSADGDIYKKFVNPDSEFFMGLDYALIRDDFTIARNSTSVRDGKINKVLVYLGSAYDSEYLKVIEAVADDHFKDIEFDIIVSKKLYESDDLKPFMNKDHLNLLTFVPNIAQKMCEADLGIGASGSTTWERALVGLPSIVITVADNQVPLAMKSKEAGILHYLGDGRQLTSKDWNEFLKNNINNQNLWHEMSQKCWDLYDGKGAHKIAKRLMEIKG